MAERDGGLDAGMAQRVEAIVAAHVAMPGALLPVLHAVQAELGWVPPAALPLIAAGLNLSRAEVHGVCSFYHDFRTAPPARHQLKLCRAEACQAMGARALEAHLRQRHELAMGSSRADGSLSLDAVYCLGNCACAPSAMLDGQVHGRLDTERLDALLAGCGDGP